MSILENNLRQGWAFALAAIWLVAGCRFATKAPDDANPIAITQTPQGPAAAPLSMVAPMEKAKVTLPIYRVEAPDILLIDAVKVVPKAPYRISPQDILQINGAGTLAGQPLAGYYTVDSGGAIDLGPSYGKVRVGGSSLDEATEAVETQLRRTLRQPQVSVTLAQAAGQQQVAGEHIVGPDGRINLGIYGAVYVAGMTLDEVRLAVEQHLSQFLDKPRVAIDVEAYNSKFYYVVFEGAGFGDSLVRFPITGNETVLDALSQVNGLSRLSDQHHIWIARPTPAGAGCEQILPVRWQEITKSGQTATNYQILPGDRIFVAQDNLYALDSFISKVTAPVEQLLGIVGLGEQTIFKVQHPGAGLGGGSGGSRF